MADSLSNAANDEPNLTNRRVSRRRLLAIGAAASVAAAVAVATPVRGVTASGASPSLIANDASRIPDRQSASAYYFC
jgi:hypothetical protein